MALEQAFSELLDDEIGQAAVGIGELEEFPPSCGGVFGTRPEHEQAAFEVHQCVEDERGEIGHGLLQPVAVSVPPDFHAAVEQSF